jgi:hypothetical protein
VQTDPVLLTSQADNYRLRIRSDADAVVDAAEGAGGSGSGGGAGGAAGAASEAASAASREAGSLTGGRDAATQRYGLGPLPVGAGTAAAAGVPPATPPRGAAPGAAGAAGGVAPVRRRRARAFSDALVDTERGGGPGWVPT